MDRFRGVRFTQQSNRFKPPRIRSRVPRGGRGLATTEPRAAYSYATRCAQSTMFAGPTVSYSECYAYLALEELLGPEGERWEYQQSAAGGLRGGAIVDFVVYGEEKDTGIRVVSYWFHLAQGSAKHALDAEQLLALEDYGFRVIDVFEEELLADDEGQAARWVIRDAVAGIQHPSPLASGLVRER